MVGSPKGVVRASRQVGLLDDAAARLGREMTDDRNETSRTYNDGLARAIFSRIPAHAKLLRKWLSATRRAAVDPVDELVELALRRDGGYHRRMVSAVARAQSDEYARRVRARFGGRVAAVRLFGSQARGEAHEESDADVLVLVDGLTHREKVEAIDLATEITIGRLPPLAPLVMASEEYRRLTELELGLCAEIARDGIAL